MQDQPRQNRAGYRRPFQFPSDPTGALSVPDRYLEHTPTFPDGTRIRIGESVTFPNLYPFAWYHTVTVITESHQVEAFSKQQLLMHSRPSILAVQTYGGYPSINWNYLPSAGASLAHPHLQGIADNNPSVSRGTCIYRVACNTVNGTGSTYWDDWREHENGTARFLFGDEISWYAHAVPLGEREVRGIFPVSTLDDSEPYLEPLVEGILSIIRLYR